jgi:hypothetical protein
MPARTTALSGAILLILGTASGASRALIAKFMPSQSATCSAPDQWLQGMKRRAICMMPDSSTCAE